MKEIKSDKAHRRVKELEVMVARVIPETPETSTLLLFTGNDTLIYQPGHFITIDPHQFPGLQRWTHYLEDLKGKKEPPRAYSLFSAPHEKYLAITVKEESYVSGVTPYPPLLSPILAKRSPKGTMMVVTGFTGPYTLSKELRQGSDTVLHACAGSGVVPSVSIIKAGLHNDEQVRHVLLYSNKTVEDTIYLGLLQELEREYPQRFQVHFFFTRMKQKPSFSPRITLGRIDQAAVEAALQNGNNPAVFVCGPANTPQEKKRAREEDGFQLRPKFMESLLEIMRAAGVDPQRIRHEGWG